MTQNPEYYLIMAAASLFALGIVSFALLRGWNAWLDLRRTELASRGRHDEGGAASANTRIEVADLRERIRKLEVIAAGVDL